MGCYLPEYIWAIGNKNSEVAFGIMFKGQKRLVMSTFPRKIANEELSQPFICILV